MLKSRAKSIIAMCDRDVPRHKIQNRNATGECGKGMPR